MLPSVNFANVASIMKINKLLKNILKRMGSIFDTWEMPARSILKLVNFSTFFILL